MLSAEPRVLADGKTVLVSTFSCGLYLLDSLTSPTPTARLVSSFPRKEGTSCAIPVIVGNYYWISIAPDKCRVVVTGYQGMQHRVVIARFDSTTGQLTLDQRFREEGAAEPGFLMDNKTWPHGGNAKGIPHGAVFSRP